MKESHHSLKEIFLGGVPRSGNTMLASVMGSHPEILATAESQFKFDLQAKFDEPSVSKEKLLHALHRHRRFRIWGIQVHEEQIDFSSFATFIKSIVAVYEEAHGKRKITCWLDSTPSNLRHAKFLDTRFPDCRFIHLVRDGRAVYASQRKLDWGSNDPVFAALKWMEGLSHGLLTEIAFQGRCLRVHFEDFVADPDKELERICTFIGIEFDKSVMGHSGFNLPLYTQGQHQLVGKKPDVERIDDWQRTLTERDIYIFESLTYDMLDMLGYERINQGILKKPHEIAQSLIMLRGAMQYLTINKWRYRQRFRSTVK